MQSKLQSLVETLFSTIVGYLIALTTQAIVFPLYGLHPSLSSNLQITGIFTLVSILRGFCIRRLFNWWHSK